MASVYADPPSFFPRGPKPLTRLAFFAVLSLMLLFADARFQYLERIRYAMAVVLFPLQRMAGLPSEALAQINGYFTSQRSLQAEVGSLKQHLLEQSAAIQGYQSVREENAALRKLLQLAENYSGRATPVEVLYMSRDPFSQKLIVSKGERDGVVAGQAIIDETGVLGQVTRVFPWSAEVTLITDKNHAVPVKTERTGLRSVLYGAGAGRPLELRFVAANVDVQPGDRLTTSGIDGIYPPDLAVATVTSVERDTGVMFARISLKPVAGVERSQYVLALSPMPSRPPPPESERAPETTRKTTKTRRGH